MNIEEPLRKDSAAVLVPRFLYSVQRSGENASCGAELDGTNMAPNVSKC